MGLASDFVLIVVAGCAGGIIARLLRLPLLVGYILAGVVVGPYTAGPTVVQVRDIETLAEIGVALLLFSLGLEVSLRDLDAVRRVSLIGGPIQLVVTIAGGAFAATRLLGYNQTEAIWFGAMISVSSTMVVLKLLAASGHASTLAGRVMTGLLLVQDLAVIPMLIVLPGLDGSTGLFVRVGTSLAIATALLAAVLFAGSRLLPPLFRKILSWGSPELFLVTVVATGVGVGAAMHAAGFSFALGAFIAGFMLSESELTHQALSDVVPLRDIFGLLFFVSVGMLFDPQYALQNITAILLAVAAIIAGKALVFGLVARLFGYRYMAPWIIGLGLSQIGEFSFVLARTGFNNKMIGKSLYDLTLTATIVSIALAPLVSSAAIPLGRAWKRWFGSAEEAPSPATTSGALQGGHIVLAGYGQTGRTIAATLAQARIPFLVVESNYALMAGLREDKTASLWGDVTRQEILHAAGIERALMLLLTMPAPQTVELAAQRALRANPQLSIIAVAGPSNPIPHGRHTALSVVEPKREGALEIVRQVLTHCGRNTIEIEALLTQARQ